MTLNRRQLLKRGALGAAGLALAPAPAWAGIVPRTRDGLVFRPYPHPLMKPVDFAYATDGHGDPYATIPVTQDGISVTPEVARKPFGVNARWFVEGFGNVWLEADNGGRLFTMDDLDGRTLVLNREFARTQAARNAERMARYRGEGNTFSTEAVRLQDLASALLEDAARAEGERAGQLANQSLLYGLWAGEKVELEKARQDLVRRHADPFHFGCETRHYAWAKSEAVERLFPQVFNYATVTHYVYDTWYEVFEPTEGDHRFGLKDNIVDWLLRHDITVEGRPLFWFHPWVTPDWLKEKGFDDLKRYVENHVEAVVGHYGDRIRHWEVVNEYHDWANIHRHTPEQITEIVRLACEKTHEVDPGVTRIINNCCPFGTYAAYDHDASGEVGRDLRTPRQFVEDIVEAGVPFEVIGVQMYFPQRSLQDIIRLVERFEAFGKPVLITEIGASSGPTKADLLTRGAQVPAAPYDWHRPWDEDLQADWLQETYEIFYSRPWIEGIAWYDFADIRTFIPNGGLVTEAGVAKPSYERLQALLKEWGR